jgi:hypothetical protein
VRQDDKHEGVDRVLEEAREAVRVAAGPDPQRLRQIAKAMESGLRPVRPLAPSWLLTAAAIVACAGIAVGSAAQAGFFGIEKMDGWMRVLIFSTMSLFVFVAGSEFVRTMIPGSLRRVSAGTLLTIGTAALVGVFGLSFRNYQITNFVSAGIACLITGLEHALPAAILCALVVWRGFAVKPASAGLIAGTLAGLAGLGVLELHCANFEAAHVIVWHTAVVPLSAGGGALCGWVLGLIRATRRK